jgi:deazaflavin-dependent oxidoreductase (nitroreductase family)
MTGGFDMATSEPTFDRGRPESWRRAFFKQPLALYKGLPAEILKSRCVMKLTTTGRKSGLPRETGVSFMPVDGNYVIFAGWGVRSDWYRNLLANPNVTIQVGRETMQATAVPVDDPERRQALMRQMRSRAGQCGPPEPVRSVLKKLGLFDYQGELDMAVAQGGNLPVVELVPKTPPGR